jgi:tripartite-type tricarboxylate transporter receptor subunit TctC
MPIIGRYKRSSAALFACICLTAAGAAYAAYPDKSITLLVAYAPGATTDLTARALAQGVEKILGVPIAVENKAGGGGTVASSILASKKPDGYTLLVSSTGSFTVRPQLLKLTYDAKSFDVLMQYSMYLGGLVVNADSPIKTVEQFIEHAKQNPGMTYSSSGPHTQQQVAVEAFARCKGLTFKHVPTPGGSTANTALLGKHVDFVAGSGSHMPLVEQGKFRELLTFHRDERDPKRPDIPVMKDIGCPPTNPANGMIVVAPAGLPKDIAQKLEAAFTQVANSAEFRQLLEKYNLPYAYLSGAELTKRVPSEIEWYRKYFNEIGLIKP